MHVDFVVAAVYLAGFKNGEEEWKSIGEQLLTVFLLSNCCKVFEESKTQLCPTLKLGASH